MKHHINDKVNITVLIIFAPIFFGVLYMVLISSVFNVDNGLVYLVILCVMYLWILVNTIIGYNINENELTLSYPFIFNLLRKKIHFRGIQSYEIIGFDKFSISDEGVGLLKYKIVLKGDFGVIILNFSREETAINVYQAIKDSLNNLKIK